METLTLHLPAMYGDHHVIEVRRLVLGLPGVVDVDASSCFQVVEIAFDPAQLSSETIRATLDEAGYLQPLSFPAEAGTSAYLSSSQVFFRHTAASEQIRQVLSFAQDLPAGGRALWPCPGLGPVRLAEEE